ncbi:MAG: class I SAM-dependent methyltransferase, partial [Gemmataceae bacterium]
LLPRIGQLISRSKQKAYSYLPASVMEFPDGRDLANKMESHGLVDVRWKSMTFGIVTLYHGTKPPQPPSPASSDIH